jgi:hypothetical protein
MRSMLDSSSSIAVRDKGRIPNTHGRDMYCSVMRDVTLSHRSETSHTFPFYFYTLTSRPEFLNF